MMKPHFRTQNENCILLKEGASSLQPDVWKIRQDDRWIVLKTFERSNILFRRTLCVWITRREARSLEILQNFPETPKLIQRPEPWAVEMTFLNAEPVPEKKRTLSHQYFDALEDFIERLHAEGLNHGDLRRKNLMINPETGLPEMVDFAQSFYTSKQGGLFDRLIMSRFRRTDRVTFLKLKRWYLGVDELTEDEIADLIAVPWYLKAGKFLRKKIYRPFKHWRQGKKKKKKNKGA